MFEKASGGRRGLRAWACAAVFVFAAAVFSPRPGAAAAARATPDFNGVWAMEFTEYVMEDGGGLPPLNPQAMAIYKNRTSKIEAGEQLPDSATQCLPHGTPRIMYTPYPVLIVQRPDKVAFLFEVNHNIRVAYLNDKLPENPDPTYAGYTVAHWQGDTLVMDTNGLNDKIQIDRAGLPQSPATRIKEELKLIDGGKRLQNRITVTDDTLYTRPWSFTVVYTKADYKIMEYVCDNNRPVFLTPPGANQAPH